MSKTITQKATFAASASQLYRYYMNPKLHAESTGGRAVTISRDAGSSFRAFGGDIKGKTLLTKPNAMIVQTWRNAAWKATVADTVLILTFTDTKAGGGQVSLVQANVPDEGVEMVKKGWTSDYWANWRAFIKKNAKPTTAKPKSTTQGAAKKTTAKKPTKTRR